MQFGTSGTSGPLFSMNPNNANSLQKSANTNTIFGNPMNSDKNKQQQSKKNQGQTIQKQAQNLTNTNWQQKVEAKQISFNNPSKPANNLLKGSINQSINKNISETSELPNIIKKMGKSQNLTQKQLNDIFQNYRNIIGQKIDDFDRDFDKKISKFKNAANSIGQSDSIHLSLWNKIMIYFRDCHPHMKTQYIIDTICQHIEQNKNLYLTKSDKFSPQFIKSHAQLFIKDNSMKIIVNIQSQALYNIISQIQKTIFLKIRVFSIFFKKLTQQFYKQLASKKQAQLIISNMIASLNYLNESYPRSKQFDYSMLASKSKINKQLLMEEIINTVLNVYQKQNQYSDGDNKVQIFNKKATFQLITLFDDIIDNQSESNKKTMIKILNKVLLNGPFYYTTKKKWQQDLSTIILQTQSSYFKPFKQITQFNSPPFRFNIINFDLKGIQWMEVCNVFISFYLQKNQLRNNQYFQQILFYLVASIIDDDPHRFWEQKDTYQYFYSYISLNSQLLLSNYYQNDFSDQTQQRAGKVARLMICLCPSNQNYDEDRQSIQQIFNNYQTALSYFMQNSLKMQFILNTFIFPYLTKQHKANRDFEPRSDIQLKYNYKLLFCAFQLITKLVSMQDIIVSDILKKFEKYLNKKVDLRQLVDLIFFNYLQLIYQQDNNAEINKYAIQQEIFSISSQSLKNLFGFLNSMLKSKCINIQIQCSIALQRLFRERVNQINEYRDMLISLLNKQQPINYFCEHIVAQYQSNTFYHNWNTKFCLPLLHQVLENWQISYFKYYARIFSALLKKGIQLTQNNDNNHKQNSIDFHQIYTLKQLNSISIKKQQAIPDSFDMKSMLSQFFNYTDYLLKFINWALIIEDNMSFKSSFQNKLYQKQDYETLLDAVRLLQDLFMFYDSYSDEFLIPDKIIKYFSIFMVNKNIIMNDQTMQARNYSYSNIMLHDNKIVTLPGALAYLAMSQIPLYAFIKKKTQNRQLQVQRASKIIRTTYNILSILILNNKQKNHTIDFKVYQSFYIDDFARQFANNEQVLIKHLFDSLEQERDPKKDQSNQQTLSGQMLDLLISFINMKDSYVCNRFLVMLTQRTWPDQQLINKRQIQAFSRILLKLVKFYSGENQAIRKNYVQINIESIIRIITNEIQSQIQKALKNKLSDKYKDYIKNLQINLYRSLRELHSLNQYDKLAHQYSQCLRVLLHPYILTSNIQIIYSNNQLNHISKNIDTIAAEEYSHCLQTFLICFSYFSTDQLLILNKTEDFQIILKTFIQHLFNYPTLYMLLNYAINLAIETGKDSFIRNTSSQKPSKYLKIIKQKQSLMDSLRHSNNFTKLSIFNLILMKQNYNLNLNAFPLQIQKVLLDWRHSDFFKRQTQNGSNISSNQLIPQSILLCAINNSAGYQDRNIIHKALEIGQSSTHILTYISVMNFLYQKVTDSQLDLDNDSLTFIMKYCLNVMTVQATQVDEKTFLSIKSWALNVLNGILSVTENSTFNRYIIQLIFDTDFILGPLGYLLQAHGRRRIRWPYFKPQKYKQGLSLLEKEYLLCNLKLIGNLLSKISEWDNYLQINSFGNKDTYNKKYNKLCETLINATNILKVDYPNYSKKIDQHEPIYNKNTAYTSYQQSLKQISTLIVIENALSNIQKQKLRNIQQSTQSKYEEYMNNSDKDADKSYEAFLKSQLFDSTYGCLDIVHQHYDCLINQHYLMILLTCYENKNIGSFQYQQVLSVMNSSLQLIKKINELQSNKSNKKPNQPLVYQTIMNFIGDKIWRSCSMSEQLYYLNYIEQPLEDQLQLLNYTLQMGLSLCVKFKKQMEIYNDYRGFRKSAEKTMRAINNQKKILQFDAIQYLQRGFLDKNQYGQSFMMSRSYIRK